MAKRRFILPNGRFEKIRRRFAKLKRRLVGFVYEEITLGCCYIAPCTASPLPPLALSFISSVFILLNFLFWYAVPKL